MSAANMVGPTVHVGKDGFPQFPPVLLPEHNEKVIALKARWAQNKQELNNTSKKRQQGRVKEEVQQSLKERNAEAVKEKDNVLQEAQQLAFQIANAGTSASSDGKELAVAEGIGGVNMEMLQRAMNLAVQAGQQQMLQGQQLALQDQDPTREQLRDELEDDVKKELREDLEDDVKEELYQDLYRQLYANQEFVRGVQEEVEGDVKRELSEQLWQDDDFCQEAKDELKAGKAFRKKAKKELKEDDVFRTETKKRTERRL